ncbi:hypothetical protein [Noviherbaspirillum sp. ST9]|uniref:hypothetical protein n=1 Tax=Noviherbaspirillum sp. ST9 TaxID=3401606 RepID=UPI003B58966A
MTTQTSVTMSGSAAGFSRYCFIVRSCLEQDFQEPADLVAGFMEQNRDRLFEMYATGVPAAAAVLAFAMEFESSYYAW